MSYNLHPTLKSYLSRNNLSVGDARVDGAVVIVVDTRYRIYIRPARFGDLLFESKLAQIPSNKNEADELVALSLRASWARMYEYPEIPVLSKNQEEIVLQYRLISDATVEEFETTLGQFVNSLAEWRRIFRVL